MRVKQLTTAEDLWEMPEVPGKILELVRGEIVEVPGATALHGLIVMILTRLLDEHVRASDLGLVFTDGTAYVIQHNPDTVRVPDASFISWEQVPEDGVPEKYWPFAPDLAVEIVSPNDRAEDVHEKVAEYLQAGTQLVWVLWPKQRGITVHRQGSVRELGPDDVLDGGEVLPGFHTKVAELFVVQTKPRHSD